MPVERVDGPRYQGASAQALASALALKADAATVTTALATKADATRVSTLEGIILARGLATMVAGTVDVTVTGVPAGAVVVLERKTPIGTLGVSLQYAITTNKVTITSVTALIATQVLDLSVVAYLVLAP